VIVDRAAWDRWLDPSSRDPGELLGLLVPNEEVDLAVYAVERLVNDVRRDGPDLIEPLVPPLTLSGAAGLGPAL
jgi:putative SOS response-associated peptidase YedK